MKAYALLLILVLAAVPAFGAGTCANPAITLAGGTYTGTQTTTVTAACTTICYTLDGSAPAGSNGSCTAGLTYSGAITIDRSLSLKALATQSAKTTSGTVTNNYILVVNTPVYAPDGGSCAGSCSVTITDAVPGATIKYCTDLTNTCVPSAGATYTAAVVIATSGTYLRSYATKTGLNDSATKSAQYTVTAAGRHQGHTIVAATRKPQ